MSHSRALAHLSHTYNQRAKVLFVASSLLEKYPSTTEGHSYVSDFLAVVRLHPHSQAYFLDRLMFPDLFHHVLPAGQVESS